MGGHSSKTAMFLWTSRRVELVKRALRALHDGIYLGLLDPNDLNEVTQHTYSQSKIYPDDAYNLSGLFPWEQSAVDQFFNGCKSVLVAAAGGGREVIALVRRGIRADGFECNPQLLETAQRLLAREGLAANIVSAPADEVPTSFGLYDGGIVGYGAYRHLVGRQARVEFLRRFRGHLGPGGPLLLSFQLRGESRRDRLVLKIAKLLGELRRAKVPAELGDILFDRFEHRFTRDEVEAELAAAGFKLAHLDQTLVSHAVARVTDPPMREPATPC